MPINIEALLKPIPGNDPCGADLRNHPVALQIKEARREDADLNQGVWKRDLKAAEFPLVAKLAKEALTKQGKDLQIAAWLTEAMVRTEGFSGLRQGLELIRKMLETYWDSVHPRPDEDGDLEMRATPLRWVGSQLDPSVRSAALTKGGHNWYQYRESLTIPTEDEAKTDNARMLRRNEAIQEKKTTPEDFQAGFNATPGQWSLDLYKSVRALLEQVAELGEYCDLKFGKKPGAKADDDDDTSPSFTPLTKSLEEIYLTARVLMKQKGVEEEKEPEEQEEAPPPEPEAAPEPLTYAPPAAPVSAPEPVPVAAAPPKPAPAPAAPRPAAVSLGAEPTSREDAVQRIVGAARFLRKENPYNPGGYTTTRGLRWGELRATGTRPHPAILVAPPTDVRVGLKQLAAEGVWERTLEAAEEAAGQPWGRAWLDVHRYSVAALQAAGIEAAAKAIVSGLKGLLADMPFLMDWTLADDTPVANAETVQWLKDQGILAAPVVEAPLPPPPPPPPEPVVAAPPKDWYPPLPPPSERQAEGEGGEPAPPDAYELAMDAARAGRIDEAFAILSREESQERSGRGRFQRRVQLAQLCLTTGNREIGRPILQDLSEEIVRRGLEQWENPEMVAQPLALLYRCLDDAQDAADKRALYARICRLDPSVALALR